MSILQFKIKFNLAVFVFLLCTTFLKAQRPWQKLSDPSVSEIASRFKDYPRVYAQTVTWGWSGNITREIIAANLDTLRNHGLYTVSIEAGYNMPVEYLSEGWFKLVKIAVQEAEKRNMHIWIIDEGKYPSGFAGGKFSRERPDLRMQGLVKAQHIDLKQGARFNETLPDGYISAIAVNSKTGEKIIVPVKASKIDWTAPSGNWQLQLIQHRFKTSVTRAVNNLSHGKDTVNSLCDYLNPDATRQFLAFTHMQYKKYIGDSFGKTVLGFRGDEPDYGFTPWTPQLPEQFKKVKGYDIVPYLGLLFLKDLTEKQQRIKADYWDVWSDMFNKNFFKVQADWCNKNGMEYMVHLNHEDDMMALVRSEGDFFRDMRNVGIPGVDAIWLQIWPDKVADFPKLASSAAHMYGRPRSLSESFAAYTIAPSVAQAKWVIDYQFVRGINLFEYMFWPLSATKVPSSYLGSQGFTAVAKYSNRASYLLSSGIPAAQIALYFPTSNLWMGDKGAYENTLAIARQLSEHQIDYDFVDDQGLGEVFSLENKGFKNLSGQTYKAVIVPKIQYLSKLVLDRLEAFAKNGGKVIFIGNRPQYEVGKTFKNTSQKAKINFGYCVTATNSLDTCWLQKLPTSDLVLDKNLPGLKYLHRHLKDGEMYFLFNESDQKLSTKAQFKASNDTILSTGSKASQAAVWDAFTGDIKPLKIKKESGNYIELELDLQPHETKFIVISQ